MKFLNQLERKLYRLPIKPFFHYVVFAMAGIFVLDMLFPAFHLVMKMALIRPAVLRGEIWRLLTFIIIPPPGDILYVALGLYFFYFIGTALENRWGARRFFLFYAIGAAFAAIAALIVGAGTNLYLNLSLFFAFAILYPEYQILLFFIIPIKVKWLALLNLLFHLASLINGSAVQRAAIIASILHILLFFGGDLLNLARSNIRQWQRRQAFKRNSR
jgi:membrane associated rhomboid family serine protease